MQVLVAQWGGTTVCSFQVGLFWEPRSAPLHLKRQESFIPLTNRSLPMCVFPEVIYTRCCLLWGLACSVICMWCWSCWRFVPLIADSHGLKQAFSCQCPWVAGGGWNPKGHRFGKSWKFSAWHTVWVVVSWSQPKGRAAATWPWGCVVSLHWSEKGKA